MSTNRQRDSRYYTTKSKICQQIGDKTMKTTAAALCDRICALYESGLLTVSDLELIYIKTLQLLSAHEATGEGDDE